MAKPTPKTTESQRYRGVAVPPELYERIRVLGRQMALVLGRTVVNHEVVEDAIKMLEKRWAKNSSS